MQAYIITIGAITPSGDTAVDSTIALAAGNDGAVEICKDMARDFLASNEGYTNPVGSIFPLSQTTLDALKQARGDE